uniref:Uncharacterized protein n=1 Tax=Heterorhabditis bacteriophora TaxID=37862 RepID=A0A1I7X8G0_HETBA
MPPLVQSPEEKSETSTAISLIRDSHPSPNLLTGETSTLNPESEMSSSSTLCSAPVNSIPLVKSSQLSTFSSEKKEEERARIVVKICLLQHGLLVPIVYIIAPAPYTVSLLGICSQCPRVYHTKCHLPPIDGSWSDMPPRLRRGSQSTIRQMLFTRSGLLRACENLKCFPSVSRNNCDSSRAPPILRRTRAGVGRERSLKDHLNQLLIAVFTDINRNSFATN